ncbi:MAG TPA: serine protease [Gemmatimonadales bacterium]|nr:serine protease [Gemmatimonadales bacterium]
MGAPWQVRAKLCAIGLVLLPVSVSLDGIASRAKAQETGTTCVDPGELARSVVSIVWNFSQARRDRAGREFVGQRATAWFYTSPRLLVTAAHFASELPSDGWQEAELRQASWNGEPDIAARVRLRVSVRGKVSDGHRRGTGPGTGLVKDLAILELQDPFPNAQVLDIQPEATARDAAVLVLGYPAGKMQAARGIIRESGDFARKYPGLALLEVQGSNRLLLNAGASGAPVLDCRQGRVVAVLNGLLTGPTLPFLPPEHAVIPTPWGSPTNTAVPASTLAALRDHSP